MGGRAYLEEEALGRAYDARLMRQLIGYIRPYTRLFLASVIFILFVTALELALPLITRTAIDRFIVLPMAILTPPGSEAVARHLEALEGEGDERAAIPLGDGRYLIDTATLDSGTHQALEPYLSGIRYLWVSNEDTQRLEVVARYPELFEAVPGGYIVSQQMLNRVDRSDLGILRHDDLRGVSQLALMFVLILFGRLVFGFAQVYLLQLTGQQIMHDMRERIHAHLVRLPMRYFNRNPIGRLVTRATNDVSAINEMYTAVLVNLLKDLFLILGIIALMFQMNPRLTGLILIFIPIISYITLVFRKRARQAYREVRVKLAKLNAFLQESISGMRIIQIFSQEHDSRERFRGINKEKYRADMKQLMVFAIFQPLIGLISTLAVALIIWRGGFGVSAGFFTLGSLVAFLSFVRMLFQPIRDLADKYNIMQGAMAASERIFMLLDEPQERRDGEALPTPRGQIEFQDVWFAYDADEDRDGDSNEPNFVLNGISFKAAPGERVAIVGPTGSGKTTIINLLLRLYKPQRGKILLDRTDIWHYDLEALRSRMAVVLQDVFLFSGDVMDNIRLKGKRVPEAQAVEAAKFVQAHDFIEMLPNGYQTEMVERGETLSVGQRQLLAFARAVAFDPQILILDEATANIDSHTEQLIQSSLKRILKGRTSLVIAHRLSTVQDANRIIVLHQGRIVEEGTHDALLRQRGLYHALYQLQFADSFASTSDGGGD